MKDIYIVLTYTGTIVSKIVKLYTRKKYSHISIGLDKELNELYSFGRINPNNPFRGGFVKEEINGGTFAKFKKTKAIVYSMKVKEEEVENIKSKIEEFKANKDKYKFNLIGLFLVSINVKYQKENRYYCAEFAKLLLEENCENIKLPNIIKPMDFLELDNLNFVYEGPISKYVY